MYLGDYIVINRQTGPYEFACESVSTGTEFIASVDEDKRGIFNDTAFTDAHPHACRFLRPDGDLIRCTIHRDSPAQCKYYRCVAMQIRDHDGNHIGTVTGTLDLHSENPVLHRDWDVACKDAPKNPRDAEEYFRAFLDGHGYRVE